MPRFKNQEEKKKYLQSHKKALIVLFEDKNIKDKNERSREADVKFDEYVEKMSADTSRDKDWEDVQEANRIFREREQIENKYRKNKSSVSNWGRLAQGLIRSEDSPEAKRWNMTFEESGATREDSVKIVKYAAKELLQMDMSKWISFIDGSAVPGKDDMQYIMLGFVASNVVTCLRELSDEEMPRAQRDAVVEILSARMGLYEMGNTYKNVVMGKNAYLYQVLPKVKDLTKEEEQLIGDVTNGDPGFAIEGTHVAATVSQSSETGAPMLIKTVPKALKLLESEGALQGIDLMKPEGKYYLVRDAVYDKDDAMHHRSAVDLLVNAGKENTVKGILKIEKMDQDKIDLVENFIKEVNNDPPRISDEKYKELLEKEQVREALRRQKEERKLQEKAAYSTAKSEFGSLYRDCPRGLGKKDELFRNFMEKIEKVSKEPEKYSEEMPAAALSVIWENRNCTGNRESRQKLKTALDALHVIKPKLAESLAEKENRHLKSSEQLAFKINDIGNQSILEKDNYDYQKAERNDYRIYELTQMKEFLNDHLDPWYHRNSQSYKDLKREINTLIHLSEQHPMSEGCVAELYKRVDAAAENYINKHAGASGELGKNRLRAVRGCLYICTHQQDTNNVELLKNIRDEEQAKDVVHIFGVRMHKTREAHRRDMFMEMQKTQKAFAAAKASDSPETAELAASYVSKCYLLNVLGDSKILDLKDYDTLIAKKALTRLKNDLLADADFRKNAAGLVFDSKGRLDMSAKNTVNTMALDRADVIWTANSRDIDIEAFRNMEENRKKLENPGMQL